MRTTLRLLTVPLAAAAAAAALASGSGMMPSIPTPRITPGEQARELYNDGVSYVKKADRADLEAAQASDPGKKDRAQHDARDRYGSALEKFEQALQIDPQRYEAWNYLGYTSRKLGNYVDALHAYDRALALKPGYPEALEYRGEAYLGVDRVADAKQAYLDLFAGNRKLADKLLEAMKGWVADHRAASGDSSASADDLDKWIQERAQIAAQTAALTRAGTAAAWR